MEEVKIPPRDVYRLYIDIDKVGKTIVWNFHTRKKNISFGLYYQPPESIDSQQRQFLMSDVGNKKYKAVHSKELAASKSSDDVPHSKGGKKKDISSSNLKRVAKT
jgi:hypothetical protein